MSKRRTRKQKEQARHEFLLRWEPQYTLTTEAKKTSSEINVKRQIDNTNYVQKPNNYLIKRTDYSGQIENLALIKKDIKKSLFLTGLILASELVIYFLWNARFPF